MKRKMLTLAAVLGITALASLTPSAEAAVECGFGCSGKPGTTVCYCSLDGGNPGWATTCRAFKTVCL
jgi:hypothetical protein